MWKRPEITIRGYGDYYYGNSKNNKKKNNQVTKIRFGAKNQTQESWFDWISRQIWTTVKVLSPALLYLAVSEFSPAIITFLKANGYWTGKMSLWNFISGLSPQTISLLPSTVQQGIAALNEGVKKANKSGGVLNPVKIEPESPYKEPPSTHSSISTNGWVYRPSDRSELEEDIYRDLVNTSNYDNWVNEHEPVHVAIPGSIQEENDAVRQTIARMHDPERWQLDTSFEPEGRNPAIHQGNLDYWNAPRIEELDEEGEGLSFGGFRNIGFRNFQKSPAKKVIKKKYGLDRTTALYSRPRSGTTTTRSGRRATTYLYGNDVRPTKL